MEYVYGAMLLHSAEQEVNEANLKKVVEAAGEKADEAKVKALVSSLDGVNIDEAMEKAAAAPVAAVPAAGGAAPAEGGEKKEEKSAEEEKKEAEAASAGLGALFG